MNKSIIADEAKNLTKGGKALANIHDDLMQGYYNRKYDSIENPKEYDPSKYGFRIQPEIGFGVPVEEQPSREDWEAAMKGWKDPLVEDLLNNYNWDLPGEFFIQINENHPELFKLFADQYLSWIQALEEDEEDE